MPHLPFPEYRPDVSDWRGNITNVLSNVLPRGDGWGPAQNLQAFTAALPGQCRGFTYARATDGTIVIVAATANRLFKLDNTTLAWTPISKVVALTSISNGTPAVFTLNSHGLENGDTLVLSTSASLPTGLTVGTIYYVVNKAANTFNVSLTAGGTAVNTSGAGSGTHSMTYKYSDVPSTDQWQFAQFGTSLVAVQANTAPQVFTVGSSAAFSDLGGSPPTARYVAVIGRQMVLCGLVSSPLKVQWSALDSIIGWTDGTGFANSVTLPDGGVVRGVAGGEFGVVLQESTARSMVYVPGAAVSFQIERIAEELGLLGPYSVVRAGGRVLFVSSQGFQQYAPGQGLLPIGKEKVDRTFLADLDRGYLHLLVGASDPAGTRAYWGYKSLGSPTTTSFDKIICYDVMLQRWSPPMSISGEFLGPLVKPGLTLESLDSVSSSIETITFSFDSVQAALASRLAGATTDHKIGFFDGSNLEAILETAEQQADGGRRVRVNGMSPRTDAATIYGLVKYRENAQATFSQTSETLINAFGKCPANISTRCAKGHFRIPAATSWTYASGVEPDFTQLGTR